MTADAPIVLTGAASGIGNATARRLLDRGSPMVTTGKLSASVWSWIVCSNDSGPLAWLPVIRTAPTS